MATQSNDYELKELLKNVGEGKIQLPEFQREWVWDDSKICKLIESITMGFPMGALMFLESGGIVNYQPRLFTGVDPSNKDIKPDFLVLDGQQRLTTLYQVFMNKKPVKTCPEINKNKKIERYYYIDIMKALEAKEDKSGVDIEDAIISISKEKIKTKDIGREIELDLRTPEDEYRNMMFPLNLMFSDSEWFEWNWAMESYHKDNIHEYRNIWKNFWQQIVEPVKNYKLPVIKVLKDTNLSSVCQIFENVNRGGVALNVFDLVTASLAADNVLLRKEWGAVKKAFDDNKCNLLGKVSGTDFLTSMTLWESYEQYCKKESAVKCKKKDVLNLQTSVFEQRKEGMKNGFIMANNFLVKQCIYSDRNLPYTTQFIPLAAIFAYDKNHKNLLINQDNLDKLARWYWCGVFGELYGSANETRYALDIREFFDWIDTPREKERETLPDTVTRSNFQASRILSLHTKNSAAYKGLMALMLKEEPLDFASAQKMSVATYIEENTDIHHIFPENYCKLKNYPHKVYDSIINKTLIYASTNRSIGGVAPSNYIQKLFKANKANTEAIKEAILSHNIDFDLLKEDNFEDFIINRTSRLWHLIEKATGNVVAGKDSEETLTTFHNALQRGNEVGDVEEYIEE